MFGLFVSAEKMNSLRLKIIFMNEFPAVIVLTLLRFHKWRGETSNDQLYKSHLSESSKLDPAWVLPLDKKNLFCH